VSDEPVSSHNASSANLRYRADACVIDLAAREILRDGVRVEVEAKVFDLIALLVRHHDRALSKRELGDALWADRAVTDAALSQLLRKARRALGDDGDAQRLIRTVHGRGLQWVAPLSIDTETIPLPSSPALIEAQQEAQPAVTALPRQRRARWKLASLAAIALLAIGGFLLLREKRLIEAEATALPARLIVLPTLDRSGESELAWTRSGLMGLMSSLIRNQVGIEVITAPDKDDTDKGIDATDKVSLKHLHESSGATHVVTTELRKLGPLYELELRVLALDKDNEYREVLRGSTPAALAAAAAERVQARFRHDTTTTTGTPVADIDDPFIAEVYARGIDAQLHGDHVGAKKYFDICLDHDPQLLWPRLQLTIAQTATGEIAQAHENAERVAASAKARGLTTLYIQAMHQLASIAFRQGDLETASQHLDAALAELPAEEQPLLRIDLLIAYGSVESERGHWTESRQRLDQAFQLAREAGDRRRQASALLNLSVLENADGDSAAALARLREALDAARAAGDGAIEVATLLNLGGVEYNAGRPLDAAALIKQCLRLAKQRADRQVQVFSAIMLSWIVAAFDHDDDARRLAEAVAAISERDQNRYWQAEAHWLLSNLAGRQQLWPQTLTELDRARALYEEIGMTRNVGQILADTVQIATRAGDTQRAQAAADSYRSLAAAESDDTQISARLPLIDAQLLHGRGDRRGAMEALAHFVHSRGNDRGPATQAALYELGRWQIELGESVALLAEPAWTSWLDQLPDAIKLRIEALRASGRIAEADTEHARLEKLSRSPELRLDTDLFVIP
jgi:DNA-binding winged helix-turn-helix (wHTH) protein/tetratricopeptide (TPR) repeat protein